MFRCRLDYTLEIFKSVHYNSIAITETYSDGNSVITTVYMDILFTLCYRSIFAQIQECLTVVS